MKLRHVFPILAQSLIMALTMALTMAACGKSAVDAYIEGADDYADAVCECDFGNSLVVFQIPAYDNSTECRADLPSNSAERGCLRGLFADEPIDYSPTLECRADALRVAAACIRGKSCTDLARLACYADLGRDNDACPDLPSSLENRMVDCLYN